MDGPSGDRAGFQRNWSVFSGKRLYFFVQYQIFYPQEGINVSFCLNNLTTLLAIYFGLGATNLKKILGWAWNLADKV
ncbi:hypothetical protein DTL42_10445 [Bremerella cremea]|uniref:Uncharacterized protein n=1 Tax=Bremerella cremea TaxID=1031537 RepID=A0A368KRQ7_9BACT|nr:hypothetical protein DTL42_10445 [Bremerella cremea]